MAVVRRRHDGLVRYIALYAQAVWRLKGLTPTFGTLAASLHGCSFYGPGMAAFDRLEPGALAAVLGEHLRSHFSGPQGRGAVEIADEGDCYRVVCDPCGSGGALRRQGLLELVPDASPETWNLRGQVPLYCVHCAQNEMACIRRLGYPKWVTDFDPDPARPCSWRVFKSRGAIPARYFERLGLPAPNTA